MKSFLSTGKVSLLFLFLFASYFAGFSQSSTSFNMCKVVSNSWLVTVNPAPDSCIGNLLVNGTFETVNDWQSLQINNIDANTGMQAAEVCSGNRIFQYLSASENLNYSLTFWAKNAVSGESGSTIKFFSADWQLLADKYETLQADSAWNPYTRLEIAPVGTAWMEVSFVRTDSTTCLLLDDVCLVEEKGNSTLLSLTCPSNITEMLPAGQTTVAITFDPPSATSTCGGAVSVVQTSGMPSGSGFAVGTHNVTFEAMDTCGNIETCSFILTVLEQNTFTCIDNILTNGDFENTSAWAQFTSATTDAHNGMAAAEICDNRIYQFLPATEGMLYSLNFWSKTSQSGDNGFAMKFLSSSWNTLLNDYTVLASSTGWQNSAYTATAPVGTAYIEVSFSRNSVSGCLLVDDACLTAESPVTGVLSLQCPINQTLTSPVGQNTAVATFAAAGGTTTCPTSLVQVMQTSGLVSGANFPIGTNTVEFAASDDCGNNETCAFTIRVEASPNPDTTLRLACPPNKTVTVLAGQTSQIVNYAQPNTSGGCTNDPVTLNLVSGLASGALFPLGTTQIRYVATDFCQNSKSCSFSVTVNTPSPTTPSCDSITFLPTNNAIVIGNLPPIVVTIQVVKTSSNSLVFQCFNNCTVPTVTVPNLGSGDYAINIKLYEIAATGGWRFLCQRNQMVSVAPILKETASSLEFSAKAKNLQTELTWTADALSEKDRFIVERSANRFDFEAIDELTKEIALGTFVHFNLMDKNPLDGDNYYQIRQISKDGNERVSDMQQVRFADLSGVQIFPNPTADYLNIALSELKHSNLTLRLYDNLGRLMLRQEVYVLDNELIRLDVRDLTEGVYALSIEGDNTRPLVKSVVILR